MLAELAVPVARLEKLWRRFRQKAGVHLAAIDDPGIRHNAQFTGQERGQSWAFKDAAVDLRAIIDEAKGETR